MSHTAAARRPPESADREHGSPEDWWRAVRLWSLVILFVVVAIVRSAQVGIGFRDPNSAFLVTRVALTAAISCGLLLVDGALHAGRPFSVARALGVIRTRWTPGRFALAWVALLGYHLTYFTYHNLKSWNTFNPPRDHLLLGWDRWLFAGHSPSVLLHDLLGQHAAAWVLTGWHPNAPGAFGQVAAFASLHVGVTAVILGIAWWHHLRRTTAALIVFLLGTMVATVYLGWHFALDDLAGLAIAAASWWLAPRTVGVRHRPERAGPAGRPQPGVGSVDG